MRLGQGARLLGIALLITVGATTCDSEACSRVLWDASGRARLVARTMDLYCSDHAEIVVAPRGQTRRAIPGDNASLSWESRFGSVSIAALGVSSSDGMNEKGLVANLLYLDGTDYEPTDGRAALANIAWVSYILDNFATVAEALEGMQSIRIVSSEIGGRAWPVHLAMSDARGDSAIIEFVGGRRVIHHGREFRVMTNEPSLDVHLGGLSQYKSFGGQKAMPGDIDSRSRFVRAASYLNTLPEPGSDREAVAEILAVARNVSVPFGAVDTSGHEKSTDRWPTRWICVADATRRIYYFQSTTSPNLYWVELGRIDLAEGGPVVRVDAYDAGLSGDITDRVRPSPRPR